MASDFSGTKNRLLPISAIAPSGAQQQVRDIAPGTYWFSALQPISPVTPSGFRPRQFAFQPGANLIWQPKGDESPITFEVLRALADSYDLLRIAIEQKKNQVCGVEFQIRGKRQPGETTRDYKARNRDDKTLRDLTRFFEKPDGFHRWKPWLRMWLEDMIVIDAVALFLARDNSRKVATVNPIAGDTINRLLTDQGMTPPPPSPAYQQVVYGTPVYDFTTDDLVYAMSNERTNRRYGFSYVERILMTINFGLRRQEWQVSEYTSGNVPEALVFLPSDLPIDRVKEAQDWFDSILAADLQQRRRLRFLPGYGSGDTAKPNVVFPKLPLLKDELDVWLAQLICFNLGISAQPLLKMINRASAEEANDAAAQSGLKPDIDFVCEVVNDVLERMGYGDDYECAAQAHRDVDPLKNAQASKILVGTVMTINEDREARGLDPRPEPEADMLGVFSPTAGFIPLGQQPSQPSPTSPNGPGDGAKEPKGEANQAGGETARPGEGAEPRKKKVGKALAKYSHGSTQVNIDPESPVGVAMQAMRDRIDPDDLIAGGREEEPHITVRYGITDSDYDGIRAYLQALTPFTIAFGKVASFEPTENSDYAAPLYVEVISDDLARINAEIAECGNFKAADFEYHPHATLAYVDPEAAEKYVGDDSMEGLIYEVTEITISSKDGAQESVKLAKSVRPRLLKSTDEIRIDPTGPESLKARETFQRSLEEFFATQRAAAAERVSSLVSVRKSVAGRLRKDDDLESFKHQVEDAAVPNDWRELAYKADAPLTEAGLVGATRGATQLRVTSDAVISRSQDLARRYAQDRAAELVGMKWVDGELAPNPDARWAISETTRDMIRRDVEAAFADETPIDQLADRIQNAGAFSDARAAMIAKTEVARAQSRATLETWKATGVVKEYKWVLSSIHKCCDACDANAAAGPIKMGEKFPSGDETAPAHPNCMCAVVATKIGMPEAPARDDRTPNEVRQELEEIDAKVDGQKKRKFLREALYAEEPADISYEIEIAPETKLSEAEAARFHHTVSAAFQEFARIVGRDFLDGKKITIKHSDVARPFFLPGSITLRHDTAPQFLVHELGHWLEYEESAVFDAAVAFLKRRTDGEQPHSLRDLTGISQYGEDEQTRPDKFENPYTGKIYEDQTGSVFYTEIMAMGLQYLYGRPYGLAMTDWDYFEFLWNVLRSEKEQ